ncbi:hypothetical protein BKA66DRAFT_321220 [Pyrenochaeta sp. MPI-SDFR-AT-0127]|nr:hypothetical protein BKA66DRAFT_321220 [Pyrenochaeta sp. MPI-SDFR-AT-0127]
MAQFPPTVQNLNTIKRPRASTDLAMSMSQACERCWRRKQKCARDFPCLQCRTAATTCIRRCQGSIIDTDDGGGESYIETLKARIRFLQMREDDAANNPASVLNATPASQPEHTGTINENDRPQETHIIQNTMQEASYLSLAAMAERTDKHRTCPEGLSFLSLLNAATTFHNTNSQVSRDLSFALNEGLRSADEPFCKEDTAAAFHTYLDFLDVSYPYIARAELDQAYRNVIDAHETGTISQRLKEWPDHFVLVYLGVATGLLLSPEYIQHETRAQRLFESSQMALRHVFDCSNDFAMVVCLAALTIHSEFTQAGGSTWHLLGIAMTRCIALGMHTTKVSDLYSDDSELRKNARAFWALYLLDTHVSSALDRPYCLDDCEIMTHPPSTPGFSSLEGAWFHMVDQAQTIRATRRLDKEDVLCTFVNLQHWHECFAPQHVLNKFRGAQLHAGGLVELFKYSAVTSDLHRNMIIMKTEETFTDYLNLLEEKLVSRTGAPASLDVVQVFAIGTIMCRLQSIGQSEQQQVTYQTINILTHLSTRYNYATALRDILMQCLMNTVSVERPETNTRLHHVIEKSEFKISSQMQAIIMGQQSHDRS